MTSLVTCELFDDKIAHIMLNRPEAANALSLKLLNELNQWLKKLKDNPQLTCMIISGQGDKVFCAGADLKERATMTEEEALETVQYIQETINRMAQMPMPTIAAMNGAAFGGGLELALACDLRLTSEQAKLGLTETSLAIIPGAGGTQRLSRLLGPGLAKRLIYTAERISGKEAYDLGIVEYVVKDNVIERALEIAKQISNNGPVALRQAKIAIDHGLQTDLKTGLIIEQLAYQKTLSTEDRIEGLKAFKEKRDPQYKGK